MPWQSLLPAGKMLLVKNDPSRDILKLSPSSLNRRQRILLTKTAELATAEATSHASLKQAREYVRLQKSIFLYHAPRKTQPDYKSQALSKN